MDYIQQNLALIDAQRAGRGVHLRLVSTTPLFLPAIGMMTGIVLQKLFSQWWNDADSSLLLWTWVILLGLSALIVGVGFVRRSWSAHPEWLACSASICLLCLGAIRLVAFERAVPYDVRDLVGQEPRLATIRGRILTQPYQQSQNWCFAQLANADPATAFYLAPEQIKTPTGWHRVGGRLRVSVDEPAPNLRIGDEIQAYCWLHRFEGPTNPGQFDLPAYLERMNVYVGASVPSRDAVESQGQADTGVLTALRRRFTEAAEQGLLEHTPSDTQEEAMLQALLLGQRRDIDPQTYEAFRKTGLAHIISLSGMNLAILVVVIWWFCKLAGLPKRARALVCMVATTAFLLAVPPMAPIFRATVMVWVYCLAVLFRRHASHPLNSLSLAAIVLLLIRPTQLFEAGWQLSFSAVAGILAFTPRIEHFLHDRTGGWFYETDRQTGPGRRLVRSVGRHTIRLFAAGTAAWLGNAGILLYHFYTVTPLASLWTVLASGPVAAIVTLGFLKILLSFVLPTASMVLGLVLPLLADVFLWIVKVSARIDFSSTLIGHVPLVLILLYYALVLFATFVYLKPPLLKRGLCAVMAIVLLCSLGLMKWHRTHRDHLSLTCLDVGHGQAILVQLPGTMNILFDAGSMYISDVGTRVVLPFLDYIGVSRLHAVVLSHHDIDHINGVPEVVDRRRVDHVYAGDAFLAQAQTAETAKLLLQHLQTRGVAVERVPEIITAGPASIETLWPVGDPNAQPQLSDNDRSLVSMIEFGGARILLCSDTESLAQQQIARLYPELKADVVVAPHHGSTRTLHAGFLPQIQASVLLCSCGKLDFDQGRVIKRDGQAQVYYTARDGAATICIDGDGDVEGPRLKSK
jgi:competence protein ComEC